jgi:hypothetical protein
MLEKSGRLRFLKDKVLVLDGVLLEIEEVGLVVRLGGS